MAFGRRYCGRDVAMKSPLSFFARGVVGVFFAVCVCGGAAAKDVYTLNAASSKFYVVDGDTVHYGRLKIRLCGIQAPEKYAPRPYKMTTKMLRQIIGRKKIHGAHYDDRQIQTQSRGFVPRRRQNHFGQRKNGAARRCKTLPPFFAKLRTANSPRPFGCRRSPRKKKPQRNLAAIVCVCGGRVYNL